MVSHELSPESQVGDVNYFQPIYPANALLARNPSNTTTHRVHETMVHTEYNSFNLIPHVNVLPDKGQLQLDYDVSPLSQTNSNVKNNVIQYQDLFKGMPKTTI